MEITLQTTFTTPGLPINRDYDTFARADGDTPGRTEGAKVPWQILAADPSLWRAGIRGQQLSLWRTALPASTDRALCVVDTGKSDGVFQMRLNSIPGGASSGNGNFVFRVQDHQNFMWVYSNVDGQGGSDWSLYRMVNGTGQLVTAGSGSRGSGLITVEMDGPAIRIYHDGTRTVATNYDRFLGETKHGIAVRATSSDNMASSRFDDFAFTDL